VHNFAAYCDESTGTNEHEAKFYVVAGYLATADDWQLFEASWRAKLAQERISAFHMTDCEKGYGEFAHLHGHQHAVERERLQRLFLGMIKQHRIFGVSTAVVLHQLRQFAPKLEPLLERQFNTPYMHAFRATLQTMADQLKTFEPDEQIAFTFDRHPQYKRAK
jgi:hypothetical protein